MGGEVLSELSTGKANRSEMPKDNFGAVTLKMQKARKTTHFKQQLELD